MTAYLIRRSLTAIVVLFGVSIFIFFMLHVIYPTPAIDVLGPHANKFSIAQWNAQHGFNEPWIEQYLRYLNQLLHGNLGYSYKLNQSVAALFQERPPLRQRGRVAADRVRRPQVPVRLQPLLHRADCRIRRIDHRPRAIPARRPHRQAVSHDHRSFSLLKPGR